MQITVILWNGPEFLTRACSGNLAACILLLFLAHQF